LIEKLAGEGSISELCFLFSVVRSGYYAWKRRGIGKRRKENAVLKEEIRNIHKESEDNYGSPRITPELKNKGYRCGHNRVARLMKEMGIKGALKRKFRPRTTDSRHALPVSPNLLKELPKITEKNQAWVSDITYIKTDEGWLYLSAIMDLWSRRIVGWQASESLKSELVTDALQRAIDNRKPQKGMICHSDRGVQYASQVCRNILKSAGIASSMTEAGNCYDNAAMESFWSTLKAEMVYRKKFESRRDARLALFHYIEVFYNRKRLHSRLGYRSPEQFESRRERNIFTVPQVSIISG